MPNVVAALPNIGGDGALCSRPQGLVDALYLVGRIKMKLGMQVGVGPGHIVLDGDPAPPRPKGAQAPPQFSAHISCQLAAKWLHGSMSLGMELARPRPGDFVLGPRSPSPEGASDFRPMFIVAKPLDG